MVLKSFAKLNLSLRVNKKLNNGFHDLQTIYCQINLSDKIFIKKNKINKDSISFYGPHSKYISIYKNSVKKCMSILRKKKLVSNFYSIKIYKEIPVFGGLGGGTSNAAAIVKFFVKNRMRKKIFKKISKHIGTDLNLFLYNQGYVKNLQNIKKIDKKLNLYFLLIYPRLKCSTKKIYFKIRKFSKKERLNLKIFSEKKFFIDYIVKSKNDLQLIVEKKYPIIKKLLMDIRNEKGCILSRMTGSGSICYGLFTNKYCSNAALKKLRKKYPKFSISIAKTI